jgi:tetratricopeptide (TPR) repeat protein
MLSCLSPDDYDRAAPLFRKFPHHLITTAVIERSSPGEIYIDRVASPQTAFMISPEGHFLAGSSDNRRFNIGLNVFRERWHQAIFFFEKAFDLGEPHGRYHYEAAVARAKVGDSDRALDHLWRAARDGWSDPARLKADPRLATLHATPDWQDLLADLSGSLPQKQTGSPSLGYCIDFGGNNGFGCAATARSPKGRWNGLHACPGETATPLRGSQ